MNVRQPATPDQRFDLQFPAHKKFDIVGLGQNAVDHFVILSRFPDRDTKLQMLRQERMAGGQIATAVFFAATLGLHAKYVGKVGSDESGRFCFDRLCHENLDLANVVAEQGARNHYSLILLDQSNGERTILWERDPKLNFRAGELRRGDVCAGKILLLDDNDPEAALQAAHWAREEGIPVVVDLDRASPCARGLVPLVDFLIVSKNFPPEFTGIADPERALLAVKKQCGAFVAATMGCDGAMAVLAERCVRFPAFEVQAVDTTGAGDVFHGAFIYGMLQNWPLQQIMTFANAAAGLNCTRLGAKAGLPSLLEITKLIDQEFR